MNLFHSPSTSCSSCRLDSAELLPTQVTWPDIRMSQSALKIAKTIILDKRVKDYLKDAVKSIWSTRAVTMEKGEACPSPWWQPEYVKRHLAYRLPYEDFVTCLGFKTCLKTRWTAKTSMSSRSRPILTPPWGFRYLGNQIMQLHIYPLKEFTVIYKSPIICKSCC